MEFFLRAYKNYANFSGRDTRQQYWMFYLFYMIASILLGFIDGFVGLNGMIAGIFALATFIPSIAIATRRLHDINKSGWWQLIMLIPIIGFIVLLVFLASKGTPGENKFGPDSLINPEY